MKIAISCDGDTVSEHFGRCEKYVIFEVENGEMKNKNDVDNPGHKPFFLPKFLNEKGIDKIICKGIGPRAMDLFEDMGIEVLPGVSGKVSDVIEKFLDGELNTSASSCEHFK